MRIRSFSQNFEFVLPKDVTPRWPHHAAAARRHETRRRGLTLRGLTESMLIAVNDRGPNLRERLRDRLERAAQLRCPEHGQPVTAVTVHGLENGWFDSTWTTCCTVLERQATSIVGDRC